MYSYIYIHIYAVTVIYNTFPQSPTKIFWWEGLNSHVAQKECQQRLGTFKGVESPFNQLLSEHSSSSNYGCASPIHQHNHKETVLVFSHPIIHVWLGWYSWPIPTSAFQLHRHTKILSWSTMICKRWNYGSNVKGDDGMIKKQINEFGSGPKNKMMAGTHKDLLSII